MLHITVIANEKGGRGEEEKKKYTEERVKTRRDKGRQGGGWGGKRRKKKDKLEKSSARKSAPLNSRFPLVSTRSLAPFRLAVYMTLFPFQQTGPRLGGGNKKKSQGRLPKSVV